MMLEEVPALLWDEDALQQNGNGIKLMGKPRPFSESSQTDRAMSSWSGGGNATQVEGEVSVWRSNDIGVVDVGTLSWCNSRMRLSRRFLLESRPCKNGVYCSSQVLSVITCSGELFYVKNPFDVTSPVDVHKTFKERPSACCYFRDSIKKILYCWIGYENGAVEYVRMDDGKVLHTYDAMASSGWFFRGSNSQSDLRTGSVIGLTVAESNKSLAAVLYSNGEMQLLSSAEQKSSSLITVFEPTDGKGKWVSGDVWWINTATGATNDVSFAATVSSKSELSNRTVRVSWDVSRMASNGKVEEIPDALFEGFVCKGILPGMTDTNHKILVFWSETKRKSKILESSRSGKPRDIQYLSSGPVNEDVLMHNKSSFSSYEAFFRDVSQSFHGSTIKESLRRSFGTEDASQVIDRLEKGKDNVQFDLFLTELLRLDGEAKEVLNVVGNCSIPKCVGVVVRKQGLSFVIQVDEAEMFADDEALRSLMEKTYGLWCEGAINSMQATQDDVVNFLGSQPLIDTELAQLNLLTLDKVARSFVGEFDIDNLKMLNESLEKTGGTAIGVNAIIFCSLAVQRAKQWKRKSILLAIGLASMRDHTRLPLIRQLVSIYNTCGDILGQLDEYPAAFTSMVRPSSSAMAYISSDLFVPDEESFCFPINLKKRMADTTEEESNPIWALCQHLRFPVANFSWTNVAKQALHHLNVANAQLKYNVAWILLSRSEDWTLLRRFCEQVLEAGCKSSLERAFIIMNGITTGGGEEQRAKRLFLSGAPAKEQNTYYYNVARYFENRPEPNRALSLFFLQMVNSDQWDQQQECLQRMFQASTICSEFHVAFSCVCKIDNARQGDAMSRLLDTLVSQEKYDVLNSLPLETHMGLLSSVEKYMFETLEKFHQDCTKAACTQSLQRKMERYFESVFAFFLKHSLLDTAATFAFYFFRLVSSDHGQARRNYALELKSLTLSLSCFALSPKQDISVIDRVEERAVRPVSRSTLQDLLSISKAQRVCEMCLEETKQGQVVPVNYRDLYLKFVNFPVYLLSESMQDDFLFSMFELGKRLLRPVERKLFFQYLGQFYCKHTRLMDNAIATLFRMKIPIPERASFALVMLEQSLPRHRSISKWWIDLFSKDSNLHVLVDLYSRHGFWLHATRLGRDLIPTKPTKAGYYDMSVHIPVQLLDRVISRARRFTFAEEESKLVVDIKTESDLRELRLALRELEARITDFFKQIVETSDPTYRTMWQHTRFA